MYTYYSFIKTSPLSLIVLTTKKEGYLVPICFQNVSMKDYVKCTQLSSICQY